MLAHYAIRPHPSVVPKMNSFSCKVVELVRVVEQLHGLLCDLGLVLFLDIFLKIVLYCYCDGGFQLLCEVLFCDQ